MSLRPPYTSVTAPRKGGKPGRKVKLSAEALRVLDRLLIDWKKHGAKTLKILRMERPDLYARLCIDASTRLTLAEMGAADEVGGPMILTVRWGEPKQLPAPPPLPPEKPWTETSPSPAMTQPSPPKVLTLLPRQPV